MQIYRLTPVTVYRRYIKLATPEPQQLKIWLELTARQDRNAFRELYKATSPKLFGFALRILNKRELAEEALQEGFVNIWTNASSYQASLATPMTWMITIVRNKALDILRRADHAIEIDADNFMDSGMQEILESIESTRPTPSEALLLSQNATALASCFQRLEGSHRQAIVMAFYYDLSHSEVSEQMKLPLGTIKTWIRRGLERLRLCLTKLEDA